MTVEEIVKALKFKVRAGSDNMVQTVTGGYASDLLSCVIAGAERGNIWVTMQGHPNVAAVASLLALAAVVVSEDAPVDPLSIERAEENKVVLLSTSHDTFTVVSNLAALGIQGRR